MAGVRTQSLRVMSRDFFCQEINPNYIGNICLEQPLESLQDVWKYGYKNGILDIELSNNFFLRFSFDENLIVNINLFKNKIAQISVLNNYLGKFKGIGIGSTLGELLKKYPNIIYDNDENFFIIPEYKSVCFFFENPYEKEQLDNKVEEITLNSYELIKYPF
ncbi:hypothetical protein J4N46_01920 [Capnocytophaga sp. Marseille-Q4570]|uniref:Uncharacterized protein n=1 Tax=Capnocytophaga bilenii TaxID=2819369 RepID=A0ABS3PV59_9FLAO|nr:MULTISPECIES: hypothetical protein [Capnocytophaga]MBO1883205.1 hypothetical protein [Capnocytophaga bilenii]